jgi:transposase
MNGLAEQPNGAAAAPIAPPARASDADDATDDRAPRGANQTAILAVVEERPGVSVAEIASVTKIAKPTVATTVSKMKREGVLADEAGGVKLASRQPLTLEQIAAAAAAQGRDEGVSDEEWEAASRDPAAA